MPPAAVLLLLAAGPLLLDKGNASAAPAAPAAPSIETSVPAAIPGGRLIVRFRAAARVRLRGGKLVSLTGTDLTSLHETLARFGKPAVSRLLARDEAAIDAWLERARERSGRSLADLNGYYEIAADPARAPALLAALRAVPVVESVTPAPEPAPPPGDIFPATQNWESKQEYLNAGPDGLEARTAWMHPGGRGDGITVADIEYDWNDLHEDLDAAAGGKTCFAPAGIEAEHGTSVLGIMGAGDNGYGVVGIAPNARYRMVTHSPVNMSYSTARAIDCAASFLVPGDVLLLEVVVGGPNGLYVPVEYSPAEYDLIEAMTASGVSVVEAAGNSGEDLDGPAFQGLFSRAVRDSGAIIVGGGAPQHVGQPPRSKLIWSVFGSRLDLQGIGEDIYTTGGGNLYTFGSVPNQNYTFSFGGTSGASPMVAASVAALQGIRRAAGEPPLEPVDVRQLLVDTGSPQQDGPYPGHIGPLPNLRAAIRRLADLSVSAWNVDDTPPLGDGDGILEPGETATLRLTAENAGTATARNILGTLASDNPSTVKVTSPAASWPDLAPAASAQSLAPHHRLTLQPQIPCGSRIRFVEAFSSDPYRDRSAFALDVGKTSGAYAAGGLPQKIPKSNASGLSSSLQLPDSFTVADVLVTVDITHPDVTELKVVLASPFGTQVVLHDHTVGIPTNADMRRTWDTGAMPDGPGLMNDFDGQPAQGTWTLRVIDDVGGPTAAGQLNSWSLTLRAAGTVQCTPLVCGSPLPQAVGDSLRLQRSGPSDIAHSWASVPGASAYRLWRSETADMTSERFLAQTAGLGFTEVGGWNAAPALVFYQVRAVNGCEWEGP